MGRPEGSVDRSVGEVPEALKVLLSHRVPNEEALKAEYAETGLASVPDTFVLYRIIGNDLYPRHAVGQSRANVKFILENEPELPRCQKRWIVNRVVDPEERAAITELLDRYHQHYLEIPFDVDEFKTIDWDLEAFPPGFFSSSSFFDLGPEQRDRAYTAAYRHKNRYLMHNNGARNAALRAGRRVAKWILPWDGNCFLTRSAWHEILSAVSAAPHIKYYVVPMARLTDNRRIMDPDYQPYPVEEPQLIFRRDAIEAFNDEFPYGRRPKVELFWRLGVPGKWDAWKDDPWDVQRRGRSAEAGQFGVAGWVARLFSGVGSLEAEDKQSFKSRGLVRQEAICTTINRVSRLRGKMIGDLTKDLFLTSFRIDRLDRLRAEFKKEQGSDLSPESRTILQRADLALARPPGSVTDKSELPPSGDPHDYFHPAPYWWPNPNTKSGLPYVKRDGQRVPGTVMYEPESERYDRTRLQYLFDDGIVLALAWYITRDERYAHHAAAWLRRWFVDRSTRMNPHLRYSQVRMGRNNNEGYGRGIIETKDFYYYLDAVRIVERSGALSDEERGRFRDWMSQYFSWLLASPHGVSECQAKNNHGTYFDLQAASIAAYLEHDVELFRALIRAKDRIGVQFSPTGVQYDEMTRTQTAHYCCFNLQGWLNLAALAARFGEDLFQYRVGKGINKGASLKVAAAWLTSFCGFPWPFKQIESFDSDRFVPIVVQAATLGGANSCRPAFREEAERVRRTKAVFHPHDGIRPFWNLDYDPSEWEKVWDHTNSQITSESRPRCLA